MSGSTNKFIFQFLVLIGPTPREDRIISVIKDETKTKIFTQIIWKKKLSSVFFYDNNSESDGTKKELSGHVSTTEQIDIPEH